MYDFIKAAFPWVAMGIAVAIFAAGVFHRRKNSADKELTEDADDKKSKTDNYQSEGMCIGMSIGLMLGTTGVCELATGLSIGMLMGLVIGMNIRKKK